MYKRLRMLFSNCMYVCMYVWVYAQVAIHRYARWLYECVGVLRESCHRRPALDQHIRSGCYLGMLR